MKKPNPLHIQPKPLAGQQLPDNWKNATADYGGNYDRRNLSAMWQEKSTTKKIEVDSPTRNARLPLLSWADIYGQR